MSSIYCRARACRTLFPLSSNDPYYGFIGDDTAQWTPNNLFRNTTPIEPYVGNPGWNLITAMADEAIGRMATTLMLSVLTFCGPRTTVLEGTVHLVLFGAYIVLIFSP